MKMYGGYEPGQLVALMVSPALYKVGNSRGEGYDREPELIQRCEVICDPRRYEIVPSVVDAKTQELRDRHAASLNEEEVSVPTFQRLLGHIGIK